MYDALFRDETNAALAERARRPVREPPRDRGVWSGFGTAAIDAVPAAVAEMGRALLTVGEAAGRGLGVQQGVIAPQEMLRTEFEKEQAEVRETIKRFTPDPQATGVAGQIVHGAGKVVGKAVAYGAAGGLPGAVAGLALDEGVNETLRLTDRGVDLGTAAKVGAVHGLSMGAGVALPAAGTTWKATAGLIAVGGPGQFMAEQQAARMILEAADYSAVAKDYNPLDPVGLAVATVLPAAVGVGSMALRTRAKAAPSPDEVAAAHAVAKADHADASALVSRADAEGMARHIDTLDSVAQQLGMGRAVDLPESVKIDPVVAREAMTRFSEAARAVDVPREAEVPLSRAVDESPLPANLPEPMRPEPPKIEAEAPKSPDGAAVEPEVAQARALVEEQDIRVPSGELDPDGKPILRSARELLDEADELVKLAEEESRAFDVAVSCYLGAA